MSDVVFFNGKKGVSPLIATVLLIAFAVALGAVIMNWSRGRIQEQPDDTSASRALRRECQKVNLVLSETSSGTPKLCYGGGGSAGHIEFTVVNSGDVSISKLALSVAGTTSAYNNDTLNESSIGQGLPYVGNVTYSYAQYGNIDLVRIIPYISLDGTDNACVDAVVERELSEIINCSSS